MDSGVIISDKSAYSTTWIFPSLTLSTGAWFMVLYSQPHTTIPEYLICAYCSLLYSYYKIIFSCHDQSLNPLC